jgi:Tfp pilus assembly PilM family ATPase
LRLEWSIFELSWGKKDGLPITLKVIIALLNFKEEKLFHPKLSSFNFKSKFRNPLRLNKKSGNTKIVDFSNQILSKGFSSRKSFNFPIFKNLPIRKSTSIGVEIKDDCINFVKIQTLSDNNWKLLDSKHISFQSSLPRESQEFANLLKSELTTFCNSNAKISIWTFISDSVVDIRHIRVPKVEKKQIENVVYWSAKKEISLNEEYVFDFDVRGEVLEDGVPKLSVLFYTTPKQGLEELKKLFSKIGFPLSGISVPNFAFQNIFRTNAVPVPEGAFANLVIDNDFSRVDIFLNSELVLTRRVRTGINSFAASLIKNFNSGEQKINRISSTENQDPISIDQARNIIFSLTTDSNEKETTEFGLTRNEIFDMILSPLERLVKQLALTFEHCEINLRYPKINKLFLSGAIFNNANLIDFFAKQLGINAELLDPLNAQQISLFSDGEKLDSVAERTSFVPSIGLALSEFIQSATNLLITYKDREIQEKTKKVHLLIFAIFMLGVLICSGIFSYQNYLASQKKQIINDLEKQLSSFHPRLDQNLFLQYFSVLNQKKKLTKEYSEKYLGMAIISELSLLTPPDLHFVKLKINLGSLPQIKNPTTSEQILTEASRNLSLEGYIFGERTLLESLLADYVFKLGSSPMFGNVIIQKSDIEPYNKKAALHFIINLNIKVS